MGLTRPSSTSTARVVCLVPNNARGQQYVYIYLNDISPLPAKNYLQYLKPG